ncbi:hypothetical protein HPO_11853 [Hyphomonas polymorpha PS728]|uniref:Uncharacterized protein n=1 Tax=Hyphomonas polymorpha PS728 TaxID=1280954 RepID=A0A062V7C5_9PROT|nr:hypothetical protein HPO_11853 [Hyphomonas polymorpha PS728]
MYAAYAICPIQIGKGARDFQNAGIAARRQPLFRRIREKQGARRVPEALDTLECKDGNPADHPAPLLPT